MLCAPPSRAQAQSLIRGLRSHKLLLLLLLSHFSRVRLCATPQMAATRLPHPWDSPGKNTGVGCHFLLQCMKVKSDSEGAQSCTTLNDPVDGSPPGSSVHGIFQARVLEWSVIAFSDLISWGAKKKKLYSKDRETREGLWFSLACSKYPQFLEMGP